MDRLDRYIFNAILLTAFAMCAAGLYEMAHANPLPNPDRQKDGAKNYCVLWAQQAVHGVAKFIQNGQDMRDKELTVIFQTPEEDKADPENHKHMVIAGNDVPTSFVITSGTYANGQTWELSAENRAWVTNALHGGWLWARRETGKGRDAELRVIPADKAVHELYASCMEEKDVKGGPDATPAISWLPSGDQPRGCSGFPVRSACHPLSNSPLARLKLSAPPPNGIIRVASNQNIHLEHSPVASPEYPKRDLCMVKAMTADDVLGRRAAGQPAESLRAELDAIKMTVAQREEQVELLEAAYKWKGTRADFVHKLFEDCVK